MQLGMKVIIFVAKSWVPFIVHHQNVPDELIEQTFLDEADYGQF